MPGKGRAMGYSDYFKNNSSVPGTNDDSNLSKTTMSKTTTEDEPDNAAERKKAIQRRLKMRKAGK